MERGWNEELSGGWEWWMECGGKGKVASTWKGGGVKVMSAY